MWALVQNPVGGRGVLLLHGNPFPEMKSMKWGSVAFSSTPAVVQPSNKVKIRSEWISPIATASCLTMVEIRNETKLIDKVLIENLN